MALEVTVYHASTPTYPGGYSVDLGAYVRKGLLSGVVHNAEQVSVGSGEITFDDPDFSLGHSDDGISGWQQCAVTESLAPTGRKRIWTGYTVNRVYSRGDADRSSLITGIQSICTCSLDDLNAFVSFRNLRTTDHGTINANRPAETDVERIQWLLSVYFLSTTLFDGLVSTANPVDMDKADYTDQKPADVIADCIQQSGKNAFVIYDEAGAFGTAGDFVLFYDFNESLVYLTDAQVSNDLADIDDETDDDAITLPPLKDAQLTKSPDRVYTANFVPYGGGTAYAELPDTADAFVWRDATQPAGSKITTAAFAEARAARYCADLATEDLRLTWSEDLPAKHVNRWLAGQAGKVKFTHLRDFQDFTYVRVLQRTVRQTDTSGQRYIVEYEATPMESLPSAAFDHWQSGDGSLMHGSGFATAVPTLPRNTTPGNLLVALVSVYTASTAPSITAPTLDTPATGGPAWTQQEYVDGQDTTQNLDHNLPVQDNMSGGGGPVAFGIWWRHVDVGEVTTTPLAVTKANAAHIVQVWLFEFPTTATPTSSTSVVYDSSTTPFTSGTGSGAALTVGSDLTGFVLGGCVISSEDYGPTPLFTASAHETALRSVDAHNNPNGVTTSCDVGGGGPHWKVPWTYIAYSPIGQALAPNVVTHDPGSGTSACTFNYYNHQAAVGASIVIPATGRIPDIPYPANQSS